MASASIVHRPAAGTSLTKATAQGMQHTLPTMCPRLVIWVSKLTYAGCLA